MEFDEYVLSSKSLYHFRFYEEDAAWVGSAISVAKRFQLEAQSVC